jgi:hypothetical protein
MAGALLWIHMAALKQHGLIFFPHVCSGQNQILLGIWCVAGHSGEKWSMEMLAQVIPSRKDGND